jgi:hypothetical protein
MVVGQTAHDLVLQVERIPAAGSAAPATQRLEMLGRGANQAVGLVQLGCGQDLPGSHGILLPVVSALFRNCGVCCQARWIAGKPGSATCSCRSRGDAGTPPRRAQRHGDWFTGALPAEPVVLCSQTANAS